MNPSCQHVLHHAADPDHDGITNLMEFGTDGGPNTNCTAPVSIIPPSGNVTGLIYTRNKLAMAELTFHVQWTDDLLTAWSTVGVTETILSDNGSIQQVKATIPTGTTGHRFCRLKMTKI